MTNSNLKYDLLNGKLDALAAQDLDTFDGLHFFWATKSPFSQWHKAAFTVDEVAFCSAEQYMMYGKATLFGDEDAATQILATDNPRKQKVIGRKVRGYDDAQWKAHARAIVYRGNHAKFSQNESLLASLLATGSSLIVEAAPDDRVWGIGLAEDDARAQQKETWLGTNWLGYVLTLVRGELEVFK